MKKSTHRPSQPSSTNLPARAESDRRTATGDNGCLVFLAVGEKTLIAHVWATGSRESDMSGPLAFVGGSWIGQLGPNTRIGLGKQIAPRDGTVCKFLNCSRMHHWHSSLTCDPFRDDRRLYAKVLSKTNTSASDRIEPFNKFFHAHMIRPSLIDINRNCLIGDDS